MCALNVINFEFITYEAYHSQSKLKMVFLADESNATDTNVWYSYSDVNVGNSIVQQFYQIDVSNPKPAFLLFPARSNL